MVAIRGVRFLRASVPAGAEGEWGLSVHQGDGHRRTGRLARGGEARTDTEKRFWKELYRTVDLRIYG